MAENSECIILLSEPDKYSAISASFSLKSISYSEFGLSPAPKSFDFLPSAKSFLSFANSDWNFFAVAARLFWSLTSDLSWLRTVLHWCSISRYFSPIRLMPSLINSIDQASISNSTLFSTSVYSSQIVMGADLKFSLLPFSVFQFLYTLHSLLSVVAN